MASAGATTQPAHHTRAPDNDGGFASVRTKPTELAVNAGDTLVVRLRGDGRECVLKICTTSRRMAFSDRAPLPTVKDEWTGVEIPVAEFIPAAFGRRVPGMGPGEPSRIDGLGFMLSDKKPGPWQMQGKWVTVPRTET